MPIGHAVALRQHGSRPDMEEERRCKPNAQHGEKEPGREEVASEIPERFGVQIDVVVTGRVRPCENLEVSKEMGRDVAQKSDTGDRHDPFESNRGREEPSQPLTPAGTFLDR